MGILSVCCGIVALLSMGFAIGVGLVVNIVLKQWNDFYFTRRNTVEWRAVEVVDNSLSNAHWLFLIALALAIVAGITCYFTR